MRGVGGGGMASPARLAEGVTFNIGGVDFVERTFCCFFLLRGGDTVGLSAREGVCNLVVEVDWEKQVIRFCEPAKSQYSVPGVVLPLTFDDGDVLHNAAAAVAGDKAIPVKVVVDTGASHALSLDITSNEGLRLPEGDQNCAGPGASW